MKTTHSFGMHSVLALLALSAAACGGATESEEDTSSEDAVVAGPETSLGKFDVYALDVTDPKGFCIDVTSVELLKRGRTTRARLTDRIEGLCRRAVNPNVREYKVTAKTDGCGSVRYSGERRVATLRGTNPETGRPYGKADQFATIALDDHRARTCETRVAGAIVLEETLPGFPGPISQIKRSLPAPAEIETLDGTLMQVMGIGGESTGAMLLTDHGGLELLLDDAQREVFTSDRIGRVTGTRTTLFGVESGQRPAFEVKTLLVCPPPGTVHVLAPVIGPGAVEPAAPDAASATVVSDPFWEVDHCPGVTAKRI
ncbi:MAG: hypothetical protein U0169_04720 [Polyangiaceae bacterium]